MLNKNLENNDFPNIVCPLDGTKLRKKGQILISNSRKEYPIENGIADILQIDLADKSIVEEISTFQEIPFENICYFRNSLFENIYHLIKLYLDFDQPHLTCVELGGGEGYFVSSFLKHYPKSDCYVCDLSRKHLANADLKLKKIRCDIRRPYLSKNSVNLAAFWVSLHHLDEKDMELALERAYNTLVPGGLLLLFEPNYDFFLRRLFMKSTLSRNVYFDEQEKPVRYDAVRDKLKHLKMEEVCLIGHNPPYNIEFLKQLKKWPIFLASTETLFLLERMAFGGFKKWWTPEPGKPFIRKFSLNYSLYFLAIFKKV